MVCRSRNVRVRIDKKMAIIFLIEGDLCGGISVADGRPFNLLVLHLLLLLHVLAFDRPQSVPYFFSR